MRGNQISKKSLFGFVAVILATGTLAYGALANADIPLSLEADSSTAEASNPSATAEIGLGVTPDAEGDAVTESLSSVELGANLHVGVHCCRWEGGYCDASGGDGCPRGTTEEPCPCKDIE